MQIRKQLLYYVLKYHGEYDLIKQAIHKDEIWNEPVCEENYITILDEPYPQKLLTLDKPPFVLFYRGDLSLLEKPMLCVIGSRNCSLLANELVIELLNCCDPDFGVISGLAKGVDGLAHEKALMMNRSTIAVIGNGCDIIYPKDHQQLYENVARKGLILSEYPASTPPLAHHFPMRNRIMAALCDGLVVVEARKQSGTMITVGQALDSGKEVYVFPYNYFDLCGAGNNMLIEMGANILKNKQDIQKIGKLLTKTGCLE